VTATRAAWQPARVDALVATWTAPHPGWAPEKGGPNGWPEQVASVVVDAGGGEPLVLIDPLAPRPGAAADAFWSWLEERRAARGALAILLSNPYHGRSAPEIVARWPETRVHGHPLSHGKATVPVTRTTGDGDVAPGGVVAAAIDGLDDGELAWCIPAARALVFADAVLGAGEGRLRLAPPSWSKDAARYQQVFRGSLRRLLEGEAVERVLVSHGPSVLEGGGAALEAALAARD
jgi:hypothetical protein